jgi:hypothetical protein
MPPAPKSSAPWIGFWATIGAAVIGGIFLFLNTHGCNVTKTGEPPKYISGSITDGVTGLALSKVSVELQTDDGKSQKRDQTEAS